MTMNLMSAYVWLERIALASVLGLTLIRGYYYATGWEWRRWVSKRSPSFHFDAKTNRGIWRDADGQIHFVRRPSHSKDRSGCPMAVFLDRSGKRSAIVR